MLKTLAYVFCQLAELVLTTVYVFCQLAVRGLIVLLKTLKVLKETTFAFAIDSSADDSVKNNVWGVAPANVEEIDE